MINDLLSKLPGFEQDVIYKLIAYQDLKLCLDVGAAAGVTTQWIKEAGSDETRILGFEPFPGNHAYFLKNTESLSNVELVRKAASSETGTSSFRVLSTVQGNEQGWEEMMGYSSTGFLTKNSDDGPSYTGTGYQNLTVEKVAISDLIDEHVDFVKIDVQGGELDVLKGCEPIIRKYGIDVMYVEFDGDRRIIEFLTSLGYSIFDTDYLLIPKRDDRSLLDDIGFYDFKILNLSTGRKAYRAKLSLADGEYCDFYNSFRDNCGQIYTDLICVSEPFLGEFLQNFMAFSQRYQDAQGRVEARSMKSIPRPLGQPLSQKLMGSTATASPTASLSSVKSSPSTSDQTTSTPSSEPTASTAPSPASSTKVMAVAPVVQESPVTQEQFTPPTSSSISDKSEVSDHQTVSSSNSETNSTPSTVLHSVPSPTSVPSEVSTSAASTAMLGRVIRYYSRWPVVLASMTVIANSLASVSEEPFRLPLSVLSIVSLLFLIGHAASKADYVLAELQKVEAEKQKTIAALERKVTRLSKRKKNRVMGKKPAKR